MVVERLDPRSPEFLRQAPDHIARYQFAIPYVRGKRVLDAGTGYGYGAALLKGEGAAHVLAVDIQPEVVEGATQMFGASGLEFRVADCEKLEALGSHFDVIISYENIEHLRHPEAFLAGAARILSDEGVLLCSTPDRLSTPPFQDGKPANAFHEMEWDREEFSRMLGGYFDEVDCRCQVTSHRLSRTLTAMNSLRSQLRANPLFYAKSALLKLLGRPWPELSDISPRLPDDYPIVPWAVANMFGVPEVNLAICRKPKPGGAANAK